MPTTSSSSFFFLFSFFILFFLFFLYSSFQVGCDAVETRVIKFFNLGTASDGEVSAKSESYLSTSSTRYGELLAAERLVSAAERARAEAERARAEAERSGREFAQRMADLLAKSISVQGSQMQLQPRQP